MPERKCDRCGRAGPHASITRVLIAGLPALLQYQIPFGLARIDGTIRWAKDMPDGRDWSEPVPWPGTSALALELCGRCRAGAEHAFAAFFRERPLPQGVSECL